jgi:hypothetical protein
MGIAFAVAVLVVLSIGTAMAAQPPNRRLAWVAALVLGSLIAGYVASRTTGIPLLAPDPEGVDAVGITTVSVELLGVLCALSLGQPIGRHRRPFLKEVSR